MRRCRLIQITGKSGAILVVGRAAPIRSCTMTAVSSAAVRYALYSAGAALIAAGISAWGGRRRLPLIRHRRDEDLFQFTQFVELRFQIGVCRRSDRLATDIDGLTQAEEA